MTDEEKEALIAQGWTPPKPVDPDLAEAEAVWDNFCVPESGGKTSVDLALFGIKRGRELERAKAKPGMVWVKHDGSSKCPVRCNGKLLIRYGSDEIYSMTFAEAESRHWFYVTHYCEILQPKDAA